MRVAMLNNPQTILDRNMVGGAERMALSEMEVLARMGVEASLFVRDQVSPSHGVVAMGGMPHASDFRRYYEWFEGQSEGYDILHGHNSPLLALISKHPRILVHLHNLAALPYYEVGSTKYRRCTFAFCSNFLRENFLEKHPDFPRDRCHAIHNGIDTNVFSPGQREGGGRMRVLFAGVWHPQKGIFDFLEAVRILESGRDDFEAVLAGSPFLYRMGDPLQWQLDAERKVLETVGGLRRAKISRVPYGEMPALYRSADVFVFPSQWEEPFGISIIEAMACGIPVVATRSGGIPEIIEEGRSGILVPQSDPSSIARAVGGLLDDEGCRSRTGSAARCRVEEMFSIELHVLRLMALYRGMMQGEP